MKKKQRLKLSLFCFFHFSCRMSILYETELFIHRPDCTHSSLLVHSKNLSFYLFTISACPDQMHMCKSLHLKLTYVSGFLTLLINVVTSKTPFDLHVRDRAWFVRLYGEIILELYRGDYRPYRRTNHAQSHLYHDIQCRPCTRRSISL